MAFRNRRAVQRQARARYYDPNEGRFLSVDPELDVKLAMMNPQSWNHYAYSGNDPLSRVDRDGRRHRF